MSIFGTPHLKKTPMKKLFTKTLIVLFASASTAVFADQHLYNKKNADCAPGSITTLTPSTQHAATKKVNPSNSTQAIFDVQFSYPMTFDAGVSCVFTGTEFWVGTWNKDSLFTMDPAGNVTAGFKIAGIGSSTSGVRAMTYDGTFIYASDNTTSIKKIDPSTKTLVGSINAPSSVRGLAYDSTANSGTGGFWISNFNTDFVLISMTGAVLETITLAEHGVPSVYGIAFDPYTSGGPYIWAFGQGTSNPNDSSKLHRIHIPSHSHSGLVHNVDGDIAIPGAIAGSVSVTWRYDPNHFTLMGCTQDDTNILFGYELNDYTPPAVDAGCTSIFFYPPLTKIPTFEVSPMSWDINLDNHGTDPITDLSTTFVFDDGTNPVFSPAASHTMAFSPMSSTVTSFGNYLPPSTIQTYNGTVTLATVGQTDQDASNDGSTYSMDITDTVMARDNDIPTGQLGLPDGSAGVLGQVFEIAAPCYATSATFLLRAPQEGDSISVDLYTYGGTPDAIILSTAYYVITAADTDGAWITLPFTNPQVIGSGSYFLGVNQTDFNITLGTSTFNWRPESAYFLFNGGNWTAVELNGNGPIPVCYLLRLNMLDPSISVAEIGSNQFHVYPNPATTQLVVESAKNNHGFSVEVFDMIGNLLISNESSSGLRTTLDVSGLASGIYLVKTTSGGSSATTKISIR